METRVNVEEGKKYLYVETTGESIKQFKAAPEEERAGIEISRIWNSAVKFYKKTIVTQEGYVAPDQYNAEFGSIKPADFEAAGGLAECQKRIGRDARREACVTEDV